MKELFTQQLKQLCAAEQSLALVLPEIVHTLAPSELRELLQGYASDCERHVEELLGLCRGSHDYSCKAMEGILSELSESLHSKDGENLVNLATIAALRKARCHQLCAYQSAITLAEALDNAEAVRTLRHLFREEEHGEQALTVLYEEITDSETELRMSALRKAGSGRTLRHVPDTHELGQFIDK